MPDELMSVTVSLPEDLGQDLSDHIAADQRESFILDAIREKLRRKKLHDAVNQASGALRDSDIPEWETPEKTTAWVHESRMADEASLREKLPGWAN